MSAASFKPWWDKYKTAMCETASQKLWCQWEDECNFAHCRKELRQARLVYNEWKEPGTRPCWHGSGCFAHEKNECNFLHDEDYIAPKPVLVAKPTPAPTLAQLNQGPTPAETVPKVQQSAQVPAPKNPAENKAALPTQVQIQAAPEIKIQAAPVVVPAPQLDQAAIIQKLHAENQAQQVLIQQLRNEITFLQQLTMAQQTRQAVRQDIFHRGESVQAMPVIAHMSVLDAASNCSGQSGDSN